MQLTTVPGAIEYLHQMDSDAQAEAQRIIALPETKNMQVAMNVGFDHRFMAKLGLGIGYNIMGTPFLASSSAAKLRAVMRESDIEKRAAVGLIGSDFLNARGDKTGAYVGWSGGYTIWLRPDIDRFYLSLYLPSTRAIHLVISDEPALWSRPEFDQYKQLGRIYIIVPQISEFVGPLSWPEYFGHRFGQQPHAVLQRLEARRVDPASFPACR